MRKPPSKPSPARRVTPVSTSVELITRSDWDNLTTEQKQAKGLVGIQDYSTGYTRGVLVNGADYMPTPMLIYAGSKNCNSLETITYTVQTSGKYQIIACQLMSNAPNLIVKLNGTVLTTNHVYPSEYNNIGLGIYSCEVNCNANDIVTLENTATYSSTGMQLFVLKNIDINHISLYNSAGNGSDAFLIDTTLPYLQVSKFGYYSSQNTFEFYEIDDTVKYSEAVDGSSKYWYGGSYVLIVRDY